MTEKRVLIIDDSSSIREVVKLVIGETEYIPDEAENGKIALEKIEKTEYKVIICDVNMPVMDGLTMVESLKNDGRYEKNSTTPIIMLTTEAGQDRKSFGMTLGITNWLVKPFKPETLLGALDRVVITENESSANNNSKILYQDNKITIRLLKEETTDSFLSMTGAVTVYTAEIIKNFFLEIFQKSTSISVDFSGITEIDSAGFQLIKSIEQTCEISENNFYISKSSPEINRIFTLFHEKNLEF